MLRNISAKVIMAHLRKNVIPDPIQGFKRELLLAVSSTSIVDKYTQQFLDIKQKEPAVLQGKNVHYIALAIKYHEKMQEIGSNKLTDFTDMISEETKEEKMNIFRYYLWFRFIDTGFKFPELDPDVYGRWTQDSLKYVTVQPEAENED